MADRVQRRILKSLSVENLPVGTLIVEE